MKSKFTINLVDANKQLLHMHWLPIYITFITFINQNFQRDAKFTLIEQITKTFTTTEQSLLLLKKRENFRILKLKTLYPDGLNQELINITLKY